MRLKLLAASDRRTGVAAVELAILLPLLAFLFVIAIDWARVFYYTMTVNDCARNGAMYLADPTTMSSSPYANYAEAALAGITVTPMPKVSSGSGSDANGAWVECTATYTFKTVTAFPGVPASTNLKKTVRMYTAPKVPY